jgi:hypothetical protein
MFFGVKAKRQKQKGIALCKREVGDAKEKLF